MSNATASARLPGLARRLVDAGLAESGLIAALSEEARQQQTPLVALLATRTKISEARLAEAAGEEFGLPIFDLAAFDRDLLPKEHLNETLIRKHRALPLIKRGNGCSWRSPIPPTTASRRDQVPHRPDHRRGAGRGRQARTHSSKTAIRRRTRR
jgi:hypothetical protein